jgi:phage shock protein A
MSKTVTRVKTDYEKEVMTLRKLVDETAKDKNKLETNYDALRRDFEDIKTK